MTHRLRRFAALAGIAALLFMQIAVSAYACPGGMDPIAAPAAAHAAGGCDEMNGSPTPLCFSHCGEAIESLAKAPLPNLPAAVAGAFVFVAPVIEARASMPLAIVRIREVSLPPAPPLRIRNCSLRI